MNFETEIILVLVAVAAACALPGTFLVLRRMSLVSDAIGHVLLFGIVIAYFATRNADSPWLLFGAAATGVLTVALVEALQRTRLVKEDAAVGLVFPALFAGGVLLASLYLRQTHLDVDRVLLGYPEYAREARWSIGGTPVKPLAVLLGVLALNATLLVVFFKELKLTTFDPALAVSLGYRPALVHYGLMADVSFTAVAAFDAVGPVLVVGFFVIPAAAALLLTDRLSFVLLLAAGIGAFGAVLGTKAAVRWDTNIAGTVATMLGLLFALSFVLAPERGWVAQVLRRRRQQRDFLETMLAVHLLQHEGTESESEESRIASLHEHLHWPARRANTVAARAERHGLVARAGELLRLTDAGRMRARDVLGGNA
ncbi:MAG: metal ABC transporter permease [Gemmataceae bacterium]